MRGGYVNRRTLYDRLATRSAGRIPAALPGHLPAEVDYINNAGRPAAVSVRDTDIPFLRYFDSAEFDQAQGALDHLDLILKAKEGDTGAHKELRSKAETALAAISPHFSGVRFTENEFVIPSTTDAAYPEELISNKGAVLLALIKQGYPVPDFSFLTARAYRLTLKEREKHIHDAVYNLEQLTGQQFGHSEDPLLAAMRCAMPAYIPGVMPTYLNAGVVESAYDALTRRYGNEAAVRIILNNLRNILRALDPAGYEKIRHKVRPDLGHKDNQTLVDELMTMIRRKDPRLITDPYYQVVFFLARAYEDYGDNLDLLRTFMRGEEQYPTMIFQKMVCSALSRRSYAGVLLSRHARTGTGMSLESARSVFGEEIMTGGVLTPETTDFLGRAEIREKFPAVYHFAPQLIALEKYLRAPVTVEFAAESDLFALLQLNPAELTGIGTLLSVMELFRQGTIAEARIRELIKPYHIRQVESEAIDPGSLAKLPFFARGASVLPRSAVSGRVYFSASAAVTAKENGEKVILAKETFAPTDTPVLSRVDGLVSLTPAAIHVVQTSRGHGIPALLNLEESGVSLDARNKKLKSADGQMINEGDWVTLSSKHAVLLLGQAKFTPARFMRYLEGEKIDLTAAEESLFKSLAAAYRKYQKLAGGASEASNILDLGSLIRLILVEMRNEKKEEKKAALANAWFEANPEAYVDGVLAAGLGDHHSQFVIFDYLTLDKKLKFYKIALARCEKEKRSGYSAGSFMLGRFLAGEMPVAFWRVFSPKEIAQLINEWVLCQKYRGLLEMVGEREVNRARKEIEKTGLKDNSLFLHTGNVREFMTLKLTGISLADVKKAIPPKSDRYVAEVLGLLAQPYTKFYDFYANWDVQRLIELCERNGVPFPER